MHLLKVRHKCGGWIAYYLLKKDQFDKNVHFKVHFHLEVCGQFFVFEKSLLSSTRLHSFDQKYSKNSNIVNYVYSLKELFSIWIYFKI